VVSDQDFPVNVKVVQADGRVELVRVGTARREGDGFTLKLGELSIGGVADAPAPARRAAPAGEGGMVFPPYGRSKGQPIAGASMQDLDFYAKGCKRTLADPGKARWHDKERVLLAAIEAEIARQRGEAPPAADDDGAPPHSDDDVPF
jgi:hypothetical protein